MKIQDVLKELYAALGGDISVVADMGTTNDIMAAVVELIKANGGIAFAKKNTKEKE